MKKVIHFKNTYSTIAGVQGHMIEVLLPITWQNLHEWRTFVSVQEDLVRWMLCFAVNEADCRYLVFVNSFISQTFPFGGLLCGIHVKIFECASICECGCTKEENIGWAASGMVAQRLGQAFSESRRLSLTLN